MTAIIYHTNISRSMYSAKLPNGSFTVFELIDPISLIRNSEVTGTLDEFGEKEITLDKDNRLHIHIDNIGLNELIAFQKTFLII